jgi:hypothetical protein
MYKIITVYSQIEVKIYLKNHGEIAVIEQDVYKNVLQRAGWALPRPLFYWQLYFTIKKSLYLYT